jgi:hypothetical protein
MIVEPVSPAIDQAFAKIDEYLNSPGDDNLVSNVSSTLLISTANEYQRLRLGYEKDIALEAWACRNLLELDVYVRYILISESNAKRVMGHITIDGIEIFQSIKEWVNHYEPGSKTPELDETLRHTYERKASEGLADTKFLDTRQLAEEVGMTADYKYIAKVCNLSIPQRGQSCQKVAEPKKHNSVTCSSTSEHASALTHSTLLGNTATNSRSRLRFQISLPALPPCSEIRSRSSQHPIGQT